jgi:hypothetical protein
MELRHAAQKEEEERRFMLYLVTLTIINRLTMAILNLDQLSLDYTSSMQLFHI